MDELKVQETQQAIESNVAEEAEVANDDVEGDDDDDVTESGEDGDDDDDDGWITPANLNRKKRLMNGDDGDDQVEKVKVACITNDFAMQVGVKNLYTGDHYLKFFFLFVERVETDGPERDVFLRDADPPDPHLDPPLLRVLRHHLRHGQEVLPQVRQRHPEARLLHRVRRRQDADPHLGPPQADGEGQAVPAAGAQGRQARGEPAAVRGPAAAAAEGQQGGQAEDGGHVGGVHERGGAVRAQGRHLAIGHAGRVRGQGRRRGRRRILEQVQPERGGQEDGQQEEKEGRLAMYSIWEHV